MATRGNIFWREDLFTGDSFWDIAQCLEYQHKGYKIVVANQDTCWMQVNKPVNDNSNNSEKERQIFLREYYDDIFPLVSIIIPTFNRPEYLKIALDSVINQTYKNLDIFITDNSTNNLTEEMMQEYLKTDKRITYIHHKDFTVVDNWHCAMSYNNSKAEYVNWLMDDDVFHPQKIAKMLEYYLEYDGISLVTSYRKLIDENGNPLPDRDYTKSICQSSRRFYGKEVGTAILTNMNNFIGEPTTVLIKKKYLHDNSLGWSGNEGKYLISDFTTWLNLLSQGDMIYITEPLSFFRQHSGQHQVQVKSRVIGSICWAMEISYAWEKKIFLQSDFIYKKALLKWIVSAVSMIDIIFKQDYITEDVVLLREFLKKFTEILSEKTVIKKCACCQNEVEYYLPLSLYYENEAKQYNAPAWQNEMVNSNEYTCTKCGAADRERAYAIWMKRELDASKKINILEIAPAPALTNFIKKHFPLANYKSADLFMEGVDYKLDIMNMHQIADNSIDFFVCSHVLEHVSDDIQAIKELKRILCIGGKGILVVPMDLNQKEIDEDPLCSDIAERWRRFGQNDHIRKYSRHGFINRVKNQGLLVKEYKSDYFGEKAMLENGLLKTSTVYIVEKN